MGSIPGVQVLFNIWKTISVIQHVNNQKGSHLIVSTNLKKQLTKSNAYLHFEKKKNFQKTRRGERHQLRKEHLQKDLPLTMYLMCLFP